MSCTKKKGYKILERNYRHRRSEIDIIAEFNNEIIFVEVKTRHENYLIEPQYAVHKIKQRLIIYAANYYLVSNKIENWAKCRVRHIVAIPSFENIAAIFVKIFNRSKSYA